MTKYPANYANTVKAFACIRETIDSGLYAKGRSIRMARYPSLPVSQGAEIMTS